MNNPFVNISDVEIKENASLKDFCTFKIGGFAKYVIICKTCEALIEVCNKCIDEDIKYKVIGFGANLLFSDDGYDGAIIVNRSSEIVLKPESIVFDAGVSVSMAINFANRYNLGGIEGLAGIPATIGGAIINNLGSGSTEISDYVKNVEVLIPICKIKNENISKSNKSVIDKNNYNSKYSDNLINNKTKHILNEEEIFESNNQKTITLTKSIFNKDKCDFGYRDSIFKGGDYIINKVELILPKVDLKESKSKIVETIDKKIMSQPLDKPSAGSIFVRSSDYIPSKIIDELGLKGLSHGGASISKKHAGFIVNDNNATSEDVKHLINTINETVFDKYNTTFDLELEIVDK